jgi:hypothetical protein
VRSSASNFLLIAAGRVLFKRGELDAFATAKEQRYVVRKRNSLVSIRKPLMPCARASANT